MVEVATVPVQLALGQPACCCVSTVPTAGPEAEIPLGTVKVPVWSGVTVTGVPDSVKLEFCPGAMLPPGFVHVVVTNPDTVNMNVTGSLPIPATFAPELTVAVLPDMVMSGAGPT